MTQLSKIPISVFDLSTITRDGSPADSFRRSVALAQHAEQLGYRRIWLAEHHNLDGVASAATSVLLAHIAGQTSTIRVGSGGVMLPNHAPLMVAEQFGTLESLFPGRIDLGLGRAPGTDQVTAAALRRRMDTPNADFAELLAELQGYFQPAREGQRVRAIPGEGLDIPIWILGSSDYGARLAAQQGLPFAFASHFAPDYLLPALDLYRQTFRPSAAWPAPHAMVAANVIVADTDDEAAYLATSLQQRFLRMIRGKRGRLDPPVESMDGLWAPQEQAVVEAHLRVSAIGSPQTVRARLQHILDATEADELIISTDTYELEPRLRSYALLASVLE
ncbi:MAG: LLM class flavin-dependent oxidoreductase [Ectothiorhodospiraceae bacterium]|nr:LLM class flavin-dependent oxidoreductase [Ectothiorhodospiraceae bacterium]MCH8502802.1 LLM class flavin-dependent oxidoreductase [Ectothiorhodospiraceae bacterium]